MDERRWTRVDRWCRLGGFAVEDIDGARLAVTLDPAAALVVEVDVGHGDEPLRVRDRVAIDGPDASGLTADCVEQIVLERSALIDARIVPPATVETVVAVFADGLNRHTFMTALFEIQKVRDLVTHRVAARAADAVTIAELERLAGSDGTARRRRRGRRGSPGPGE